ncbi:hypothetical protein DYD21_16705 [Rhodohalobacter sp. SW132]|uniref:hypothetical protein n=1 Tax=Rhodohalobacter sp. SW132 TaxID=2293433 RepID=UPI000E2893E7|nr:hypothetical protein [Rhodohalobacter sp. SW132]REL24801.1 hypothetical protein DYD21_16705 [Rhodohalobacter sp. SW132]
MKKMILICVTGLMIQGFGSLYAQSEITFQVDITHLLDGSEFDENRDRVELIGNRSPLSAIQPQQMKPDENNPNLFKVSVTFPGSLSGNTLEYQFRVMLNNRYRNEDIPRSTRIPSGNQTLDSIYFNSYAW